MSVGGNSSQNRSLSDHKERGAGRQNQNSPEQEAIREFQGEATTKPVSGAHGREDMSHRETPGQSDPGGGAETDNVSPGT